MFPMSSPEEHTLTTYLPILPKKSSRYEAHCAGTIKDGGTIPHLAKVLVVVVGHLYHSYQ